MSHYMMGVFYGLVEEFHVEMVHDNIYHSCSMVHAQQFEESTLKRKNTEVKRERPYDRGTSKGKFEIQHKLNINTRFSNKFLQIYPRLTKIACLNLRLRGDRWRFTK